MSTQKKLYALIVGVDKYKHIRQLNQAVNDAKKVEAYLKNWSNQQSIEYKPLPLTNENATRKAIIEGFQNHLMQAQADDLVFFYFSGHGSQEEMDDVFSDTEHDGKLETIVAVDSRGPDGIPDIADKELRYLIHQVSQNQPHIFCVFDSCHSGTNTRLTETVIKRFSTHASTRDWKDFVFSEQYETIEDFKAKGGTNIALPEGQHIQIAACQNNESAYEKTSEGGIFTKAFLNTLESTGGGISYYSLIQRIRYAINRKKYPQTPQVYVSGNEQDIFQPFMQGDYNVVKQSINIAWEHQKSKWKMDIGAMHGLPNQPTKEDFPIEIEDLQGKKVADAFPLVVNFSETYLQTKNETTDFKRGQQYIGKIKPLSFHSVDFYLDVTDENIASNIQETFEKKPLTGLIWVEDEADAQYILRHQNNELSITYPNDNRPLIQPIQGTKLKQLRQYLDHIIKWEFALHLAPVKSARINPIQIEFSKNNTPLEIRDKIIETPFDAPDTDGNITAKIKLKITNTGRKTKYFALVGFTHQFGVYTNWLGEQVVRIKGRESISVDLPFFMPDYIPAHNWQYSPTWLKVFAVADAAANISLMAQDELPEPDLPKTKTRSGIKRRSDRILRQEEWFVDMVEVRCLVDNN